MGFTRVARQARAYDAHLATPAATERPEFVAVALHGPRTEVNRLTHKLPLMS
ncbi:DUF2000 family protein [Saccharothrix australiensis]|uniref:DUF2000 family protein n=1 Tax=Saccharothrix australiensis TaxID=2072 RepID=UPI000EAEA301|nr:DUF2000 family protein [Saccharothrix australiensis]